MMIMRLIPLLMITLLVSCLQTLSFAGQGAYYHPNADRLFWFMILSDTHIGAAGNQDANNLNWAVSAARQVIAPLFIVNAGDLTDSTNGGIIPNGPYQAEWDAYRQILENAGLDASTYYDIPGNHDAYNDANFAYYLANSIQGRATGTTQPSWVKQFPYGRYHFLGVCTPGNDGAPFSIWPEDNYGDHAGLDANELAFIQKELSKYPEAQLSLIFGHHPFEAHYSTWTDTALTYGLEAFLSLVNEYGICLYGFGHTHQYRENFYFKNLTPGVYYMNVASLGKSDHDHIAVMAVDGNGLSMVPVQKDIWPVVLITAPADRCLGKCANPFAYEVPQGPANPIRALIFDPNPVTQVQFRIDGSTAWQDMQRLNGTPIWEGHWNAAIASPGSHVIEVRAQGSTLASDQIQTSVNPGLAVKNAMPWLNLLLLAD
jgi:3',5'-cyclic AMP phosphodiesterase CpdA